jgi:hypothetical protein
MGVNYLRTLEIFNKMLLIRPIRAVKSLLVFAFFS